MSQIHLMDYLNDINPKLCYMTWDVDLGKGNVRKGFSKGFESPKEALERAMCNELDNYSKGCKVVRWGSGVLNWYKKETIADPPLKQGIVFEITLKVDDVIHFLDEGDYRVKAVSKYKDYPWVLLSSLESKWDIIMSLRAINNKLRKGSKHRSQNYLVLSSGNSRSKPAYWFTIGYLLKNKVELNIRTTPKTDSVVVEKYKKVTGEEIKEDYYNKYIMYNPNNKTFADNADLRIPLQSKFVRQHLYFPENKVGKREGAVKNNIEHIQNTNYVWTLFNYGFRLGIEHNKNEIFEYVTAKEPKFLEDFEKGYKYNEIEN